MDPVTLAIVIGSILAGLGAASWAALKGWQDWLELKRFEITHDITPYGEEWRRFGEYVQQQLGKLGIKVNLRYEDVPTWLRRVYTNYDYELTNNWIQTLADPVIGVHRLYHSKLIKPGTVFVNGTQWSSARADGGSRRRGSEVPAAHSSRSASRTWTSRWSTTAATART